MKIKTGHLFSIAKLNFESICFLAFFDLKPFKLVHRHLKFLAFLHSENEVKICKIDKWPKITFRGPKKVPKVSKWGFWGGLDLSKWSRNFDSRTRSAIFSTPKTARIRIKILRPLLEIQTTPKTPI